MIQAKDLRIGNSIIWQSPVGNVCVTVDIDTLIMINDYNGEHFYPVQLNKEILLQCGFEKSEYNKQEQWLSPVIIRHNPYSEYRIGLMTRPFGYTYEEAVVKLIVSYLHQLQNLFFALTSEELEMNTI